MRVLVTGGAGFIGSHVVAALRERGHEPLVFDVREDPGADVRDPAAVGRALSGVDAVCHQAAMVGLGDGVADAAEYVSRNDLGTAVLLAAMAEAGVGTLPRTSGSAPAGGIPVRAWLTAQALLALLLNHLLLTGW
ncbi:UDP-glucose 4-epimerase [Streptomyces viridosporus ATCC 14672]|uniref:UDP-glucose 4-epimerase n=1 Tax=Streptomyces viridosporus (strain ATCC 14672 / DSM 40746 / JCM 4963 / KCTC 9882 / NRRL B-12104 / FH 1290) TaxID=566461 RepID=D5ZPH5_STRV1|nr:NAD-dependent epimerase/dehydratase family protein [Streptomyces viridosporus]EFE68231.1 UDP-glucose 4-epimerase [Streptomyces viridosporus ATCC 14672]